MSAHLDITSLILKTLDAVVFQAGVFCHGCTGFSYHSGFRVLLSERRGTAASVLLLLGSGEGEERKEEDVTDRRVRGGAHAHFLHGLSWFPRLPRRSNNKFTHNLLGPADIFTRESRAAQSSFLRITTTEDDTQLNYTVKTQQDSKRIPPDTKV